MRILNPSSAAIPHFVRSTLPSRVLLIASYPRLPPFRQPFSSTPVPKSASLLKIKKIHAPHYGHIRVISLNSPDNLNAISIWLLQELGKEICDLSEEKNGTDEQKGGDIGDEEGGDGLPLNEEKFGPTRCLVLASELDKVFSSGADLKERQDMTRREIQDFLTALRQTFNMLSSLPIPSIAAISGLAFGGGFELALACTLRVFTTSAIVCLPETRIGIIPGAGGTYRLRNLIGEAAAMHLILTGRRISGPNAWRLGICDKIADVDYLPPDDGKNGSDRRKREIVLEEAMMLASDICSNAPLSIPAAMRAIRGGTEQAENEAYESLLGTDDRVEALRAWKAKEPPIYQGR